MQRSVIIDKCQELLPEFRLSGVSVIDQIRTLIMNAPETDLVQIKDVLSREYEGFSSYKNMQKKAWAVHSALDFLASKLVYFGKIETKDCQDFGLNIHFIPETMSIWRDEKISGIID